MSVLNEVSAGITLPSDWYSDIVGVVTSNAPALLAGFLALFAVGFGLYWVTGKIKSSAKKAA